MRYLLLVLGVVLAWSELGAQAPPAAKRESIRQLLEVTGQWQTSRDELNRLINAYQRRLPKVRAAVWLELRRSLNPEGLEEAIIDVYDELLSEEEVAQALAFYQSEAGKKLARLTPQLRQRVAEAVQAWQQEMAGEINRRLNEAVRREKAAEEPAEDPAEPPGSDLTPEPRAKPASPDPAVR